MPRLTRTQKFAELRDSLANDKESSLQTKDLSNYEDRLNSITELLSSQNKTEEAAPAFEMPAEEPAAAPEVKEETDPKYTWTDFEETPIEALVESFKSSELEKQIQEFANENQPIRQESEVSAPAVEQVEEVSIASTAEVKPLIDTPVYEAPVIDEPIIKKTEEEVKPLIDETPYLAPYTNIDYAKKEEPVVKESVYTAPLIQDEVPTYETPVVEEKAQESEEVVYPGYYRPSPEIEALYKEAEEKAEQEELVASNVEEAAPVIEEAVIEVPVEETEEEVQTAELVEEPVIEEPVTAEPIEETESIEAVEEEPAKEEVREEIEMPRLPIDDFVDNHMADHEAETNTYLSDMMAEVDQYNTLNGDLTISQLTNNMVNEVRHPELEEVKAAAPVEEVAVEETSDEEFSNTVSMEIAKIMDEIDAIEEEPVKVPEQVVTATPAPVYEEPVKEEHPVLAKALEEESEEEVIEIKNLKELEAEPTRDTVSNTIPFVVTTDDDEEEIEDDEEDGSNTILNIILIVLIIVLVAVLGLIVFYILKTKGVI